MNEKYILSLDVSTSTIGCCLWKNLGDSGEIISLTHISPEYKRKKYISQYEKMYDKALLFGEYIHKMKWNELPIEMIIIEEPLINAATGNIAAMLNQFAGLVYFQLRQIFSNSVKIDYISVNDARTYGLPEYYTPNAKGKLTLFGNVPKTLSNKEIKDYKKMLIMGQVAKRFPQLKWNLNGNKTICKKNFDKADSVVVCLGYMAKKGFWQINPNISYDSTLDLIKEDFKYKSFVSSLPRGNGKLNKVTKIKYLIENFNINKYLNMDLFIKEK